MSRIPLNRQYGMVALGTLVLAGGIGTAALTNSTGTAHADANQGTTATGRQQPAGTDSSGSSAAQTASLPTPPNGWFAGHLVTAPTETSLPVLSPTDPINLVLTDPAGNAASDLVTALKTAGPQGKAKWADNTCYDSTVTFASEGTTADPRYAPTAAVLDNDPSTTPGGIHINTGCGTKGTSRNHLRLWTNENNTIAWVAASVEYVTDDFMPHRLQPGAFDTGRDQLVADLKAALPGIGKKADFATQSAGYTCANLQNNVTTCDGKVVLVTVQDSRTQPCAANQPCVVPSQSPSQQAAQNPQQSGQS